MFDENEIIKALKLWFQPGDVFEVRILDASTKAYQRPHVESGYFDYEHIADVPKGLAHIQSYKGVYVTVNPVNPDLLSRAVNRVRNVGREPTTSDSDIVTRRWLLIDCDAKRPSGIPSSDTEHELAMIKAHEIQDGMTRQLHLPLPIIIDSGNGAQLMYRIDLPTNDDGLIQRVLQNVALASNDAVDIDLTVHNPARIWRLPGTLNSKGDHTERRPHRMDKITSIPESIRPITKKQLESLCAEPEISHPAKPLCDFVSQDGFDIDRWINEHCRGISAPEKWKDGRKWVFDICPFNSDHTNRSAVITQQPSGAIGFTCHHNGCIGNDWKKLRELLDPDSCRTQLDTGVDLTAFFDNLKVAKQKKENIYDDPGALPERLLHVPGFVNDVMKLSLDTAPYPNKTLAFSGALAFLAHLVGRKVRDKRNNHTNLYLIALADSGTGKDHPRKVNFKLALDGGIASQVGDAFASGAGLEDAMYSSPSMLFQMDEIDWVFNIMKSGKGDAASESVNEKLLKFYGASNSLYPMRKKALSKNDPLGEARNSAVIVNPNLVLFGTAIPKYFYESLSQRSLENGLIARCIIFEANKRGRGGDPCPITPTKELREQIKYWVEKNSNYTSFMGEPPPFIEIPETEEASVRCQEIKNECDDKYDGYFAIGEDAAKALWARAAEKIYKLAMLYGISANIYNPIITVEAVNWAYEVVNHLNRKMLYQASMYCYESSSDKDMKRILQAIRRKGGTASRRDVMRAVHMTSRQFEEMITTMRADSGSGVIEVIPNASGKKKDEVYRVI